MKRFNVLLLLFSMLLCLNEAMSAETNSPPPAADAATFDYLKSKQGIVCNNTTNDGQISSAGLSFNCVYRDYSAEKGAPVILSGSFNIMYTKGKVPYYSLKMVPSVVLAATSEVNARYPDYLDVMINGQSIGGYKDIDNKAVNGGRLIGYADKDLVITRGLLKGGDFDIVVRYSIDNGAHYNDLRIFSIVSAADSSLTKGRFRTCINDMSDYLGIVP